MECEFKEISPGVWQCQRIRCGIRVRSVQVPRANCRATVHFGDTLEQALESIGVTQDRWKALKSQMGLPPSCNCDARKQWLNMAGEALQIQGEKLGKILSWWYSRPR